MMKNKNARWFPALFIIAISFSGASYAGPESVGSTEAVRAALDKRNEAITQLSNEEINFVTQDALNSVILRALSALHTEGYAELASTHAVEWNREYADLLIRRGFDLGDHRPLLQWLVRFNATLERTIGKKAAHRGILGDIYDLNYAIPVSFTPRGKWRTHSDSRNIIEYRKHFVPLTNVVIYWSSLLACEKVMRSHGQARNAKKLCKFVAEKLRVASNLYIGPKLSNYVFRKANGLETRLDITNRDLVHTDPELLLSEFNRR